MYVIATQTKTPIVQAAALLATTGAGAVSIFNTFNLTIAEQENIEIIKETFTKYFTPKTSLTYQRYTFNKILQKERETFDEYLTNITA